MHSVSDSTLSRLVTLLLTDDRLLPWPDEASELVGPRESWPHAKVWLNLLMVTSLADARGAN